LLLLFLLSLLSAGSVQWPGLDAHSLGPGVPLIGQRLDSLGMLPRQIVHLGAIGGHIV
jgi:hypothetical protein